MFLSANSVPYSTFNFACGTQLHYRQYAAAKMIQCNDCVMTVCQYVHQVSHVATFSFFFCWFLWKKCVHSACI